MCSPKSGETERLAPTPVQRTSSGPSRNFVHTFLLLVRAFFDSLVNLIFSFIYKDEYFPLSPVTEPILLRSATDIARKIRTKEISCVKVVQAFIRRIEQVNPKLNAVVEERFAQALEEARAVDRKIALDEDISNQPFLGVPFTCKESTACAGCSNTLGLLARKGKVAVEDAYIVERMKAAGAILLGVTNIPELLWSESRNLVYGQSNNPYNLCRTTGASSGGEACIVSACGSSLGLGSDLGGSIRIPALYCGVYGHKMTTGSTSTRGIYGRDGSEGTSMLSAGPIVKHAEDLLPFTRCLLRPEVLPEFQLEQPVDLSQVRVFYVEDVGDVKVSPMSTEMLAALRNVVSTLEEVTGHAAEDVSHIEQFRLSYDLWRFWCTKEKDDFPRMLYDHKDAAVWWKELAKLPLGLCTITLPSIMKLVDMQLPLPSAEWAEKNHATLQRRLTEMLGSNGVLIYPSAPEPAPYHYATFFRLWNFTYWALFNVFDFPVTQVPAGLDKRGLPLGVQVVAGSHNDRLCFAVAEYLEKCGAAGWRKPF